MATLQRRNQIDDVRRTALQAALRKQKGEEFPRGGHVPNPPESCPWRAKFDNGNIYWTETVFCGFECAERLTCSAFADYQDDLTRQRQESQRKLMAKGTN